MPQTEQNNLHRLLKSAHKIFERANQLRLSDPQTPRETPDVRDVIDDAQQWLAAAIPLLQTSVPADALQLLHPIDLIHRIATGSQAPATLTDPVILKALSALLAGDHTLSDYDLFPHINAQLLSHNPAFAGTPLTWHSLCITRWLRNIQSPTRRRRLSPADLRAQSSLLRTADLWPYLPNQTAFKSTLPR